MIHVVIFTIMASSGSGSDTESLPDLDEFLASIFDPDISDNKEEVWGEENTDSLGLDVRAIFVRLHQQEFRVRDIHNQTLALAAALAAEGTLIPSPSKCNLEKIYCNTGLQCLVYSTV